MSDAFAVGERCFAVADLGPSDAADVIALHRRVFGTDIDAAWYRWKYAGAPAAGVRDEDGRLIAHCGGIPRRLVAAGRTIAALQIGDVMVEPRARGWLTRRGPFFQVSRHLYASQVGAGRPYELAFGFPNERHLRLGVSLGLMYDGGPVLALEWPAGPAPGSRCSRIGFEARALDRLAGRAWSAMRRGLGHRVAGSRDAAYLRWRYGERPGHDYAMHAVRTGWRRALAGLIVLRRESAERMAWLDWIGPPEMLPVGAAAARSCAAAAGARSLAAWASPEVVRWLAGSGAAVPVPVARFAVAVASLVSPREVGATAWWWMGGDTDFL
jgi:hypothetical protein